MRNALGPFVPFVGCASCLMRVTREIGRAVKVIERDSFSLHEVTGTARRKGSQQLVNGEVCKFLGNCSPPPPPGLHRLETTFLQSVQPTAKL